MGSVPPGNDAEAGQTPPPTPSPEGEGALQPAPSPTAKEWSWRAICCLLEGLPLDPINGWEVPVFPLKGGEIVARGVGAGPEVARLLKAVENRWIAEGFPARERVEELLGEELSNSS